MTQDRQLYSLDKLREIDNAEDFILQVIGIFLDTVPSNMDALVKACAEKDWENVYFFAHKIKSNVILLNIDSILEDIRFTEQSAKNKINLEALPVKINFIEEVVTKVAMQMKAYLAINNVS
ncbi:MAG: Hpt domain-containing protein [Panacibacter sp.]